jgi:fructose-bisphosphate aldolase class 1
METISLKVLADKVLQRNSNGNSMETKSFPVGKKEGLKVSQVSQVSITETIENDPRFVDGVRIQMSGGLTRQEAEDKVRAIFEQRGWTTI